MELYEDGCNKINVFEEHRFHISSRPVAPSWLFAVFSSCYRAYTKLRARVTRKYILCSSYIIYNQYLFHRVFKCISCPFGVFCIFGRSVFFRVAIFFELTVILLNSKAETVFWPQ